MRATLLAFLAALICSSSPLAFAAGLGVTQPDRFSTADGFQIELLYEVPADKQGSWVALTVDPKGRLLASDQYGGVYQITLPDEASGTEVDVKSLNLQFDGKPFEGAQGLLCAFGSLYANVNSRDQKSGVYRFQDSNGDGTYDQSEHLIPLNGGSEHGPHAMILTPDGERILMVAGNSTNLPENIDQSRVPQVYQEDHLLGRMPDARGHNADRMAPGGFILSFDPDGANIELISNGFRNPYDIALNADGELFTYDADMEWDVGTPWYRPTRINHVISGSEFGWRNGTGKWPAYYPDSFGSVVDIGPGSPTGICFGYGAKFPAKYQKALFIADWSYGNIHAVHLSADGSSYTGEFETFATAAPLPATDLVVHPGDGAMYMTVGGRQTQSGLYRLTYVGDESTDPIPAAKASEQGELVSMRHELEKFHLREADSDALKMIVEGMSSDDRGIRYASRVALEKQGAETVRQNFSDADSIVGKIHGVIALARTGDASDQAAALETLGSINSDRVLKSEGTATDLLRAYGLVAMRLGEIDETTREQLLSKFAGKFPTGNDQIDRELSQWLVYLGDESATGKIVDALLAAPSQESQIHYAMTLRNVDKGWTEQSRREYFQWFNEMKTARGGMSFGGFLDNIKAVAVNSLQPEMKQKLASVLEPVVVDDGEVAEPRPLVKQWTVSELEEKLAEVQSAPNYENGLQVFAAGQCYKCHRMGLQGGILGPDLTSAGGKYGVHDMLVSIVEPSKVISDQYAATTFLTYDGDVVVGRIINMSGNKIQVLTNMLDPSSLTQVQEDQIEQTKESDISMMPSGLLDTFTIEEIADLVAYLRAGGNKNHVIYKPTVASRQ